MYGENLDEFLWRVFKLQRVEPVMHLMMGKFVRDLGIFQWVFYEFPDSGDSASYSASADY